MNAGVCGAHGGPVGEELRLLALALLDRLEPGLRSVLAGLQADSSSTGAREPACQWCPLCSLIAVLRGDHPELGGRLTEHAAALLTALRALLEGRPAPAPAPATGGPPGGTASTGGPSTGGPSTGAASASAEPRVQRIQIRRDDRPDPGAGGGC